MHTIIEILPATTQNECKTFCNPIFMDENKKLRILLYEFVITLISFFGFIWSGLWNAVSEFIAYKGW
ncbi:MAG: hypothetical protein K2O29_02065 [Ruminococcus sp.]|nr:hypothetical protein [Ruminococcus sp.]MDE6849215.1 hypothetical protein [Ruminococcus sp.]MDE7137233.1 hypothetical protein [Ruminococcus sp.]